MAEAYGLPSSSMGKVQRWLAARRAAGHVVQPWELESAYEAEMNSLANKSTANRGLALQAEGLAETKRMNDVNSRLREEEIDASKKASTLGAVGTLGTTALAGKALGLWGKDAAEKEVVKQTVNPGSNGILSTAVDAAKNFAGLSPAGASSLGTATGAGITEIGSAAPFTSSLANPLLAGTGKFAVDASLVPTASSVGAGTATAGEAAAEAAAAAAGEGAGVSMAPASSYALGGEAGAGAGAGLSSYILPAAAAYGLSKVVKNNLDYGSNVFQKVARNTADTVVNIVEKPIEWVSKAVGCIIVTACTSPDSEEVNITREYRDRFLTAEQLRGYYMIAEKVVPLIVRFPLFKKMVKKILVDNLIEFGRHSLGKGPKPSIASVLVTRLFVNRCGKLGSRRKAFVRYNGEVI